MNPRRLLARSISEAVAGVSWMRSARSGLRVLMYHAIGTPALGDSLGLFSLKPECFRRHMTMLANWEQGRVVELAEELLSGSGCRVAITFDDGYLDNLEVAAPILNELGLPFTVFVTSEFVRHGKAGFLSPSALRNLAALPGVRIGAHGANHVALTKCDDQTLRNELSSSRRYLEEVLGCEVRTLAYHPICGQRLFTHAFACLGRNLRGHAVCQHFGVPLGRGCSACRTCSPCRYRTQDHPLAGCARAVSVDTPLQRNATDGHSQHHA